MGGLAYLTDIFLRGFRLTMREGSGEWSRKTLQDRSIVTVSLVFVVLAGEAAFAQATIGRGFGPAYEHAAEVSILGTVQGFAASDRPLGLHMLLECDGAAVDAHLGPYLPKDIRNFLRPGQSVQVTGIYESVHDKRVFLVRELIFNGRLVTVRNAHGFLVHAGSQRRRPNDGMNVSNGGAR